MVSWLAAAFDQINQGVVLLDGRQAVCFANQMARAVLASADGLRLNGTTMGATTASQALLLTRTIALAISAHERTTLRLRRPAAHRPLTLSVLPLAAHADWPLSIDLAVLVLISVPERLATPCAERLVQTYGLTRTEACVAHQLLLGRDIAATAVQLAMRRETARTHLRRIMSKTGTHKQSELIWRLQQEVGGFV